MQTIWERGAIKMSFFPYFPKHILALRYTDPDNPSIEEVIIVITNRNFDVRMLSNLSERAPFTVDTLLAATANTPIMNPDAEYLANTTKIDISGLPKGSLQSSITDGVLTVTFSNPLEKQGPVPDGWATWSSPPFSEDPNPDVLISGSTLTMTLSRPVQIFGFELEPSPFGVFEYTAEFYRNGTLVESITREVDGSAGARLFARTGEEIDEVVVTGPFEFAIAQVRYALPSPEPLNTLIIFAILILLLILAVILLS